MQYNYSTETQFCFISCSFATHHQIPPPPKKHKTNQQQNPQKATLHRGICSTSTVLTTEPKWNKSPQHELKRAWQVYRTLPEFDLRTEISALWGFLPTPLILPTPESWNQPWKIHAAACFKHSHEGSSTSADLSKPWWLIWKIMFAKCFLPERKMSAQTLLRTNLNKPDRRMSKVVLHQLHRQVKQHYFLYFFSNNVRSISLLVPLEVTQTSWAIMGTFLYNSLKLNSFLL